MIKVKKILITGASRGIGRALALSLAEQGHHIGLHYGSDKVNALSVAEEIRQLGGTVQVFQADFDNPHSATTLAESAWSQMGLVDVLINNAGISYKLDLVNASLEDMQHFLRINYLSAVLLTQAIASKQIAAGIYGSIFSMSSVNAVQPGRGLSAYGASKAALETYMKGAAVELAAYGIRVNTLLIGAIQTDMNAAVWKDPQKLSQVEKRIPLGRLGQPGEVAAIVSALIGTDAYMTGSSIRIDGGWLNGNY